MQAGTYYPNQPVIQHINRAEFQDGIIRLGTGELSPELLPSEKMKQIFEYSSVNPFTLGYEEPKGNQYLREQIAVYLHGIGVNFALQHPYRIWLAPSVTTHFYLTTHRGSTILLEKPSYLYSVHVFQSSSIKLVGLPMDEEGIQTNQISRYKEGYNASLLYTIPTFHNPTSTMMSEPGVKS